MGRFMLFIFIYVLFIIFELVPLFKSKKYKIFTAYSLLVVFAFVIQMVTLAGYTATSFGLEAYVIKDYISKLINAL